MRSRLLFAVSLATAMTFAPAALAQPVDAATKAAARSLAEEGIKLYDRGDYPAAQEKLSRAYELVRAPTMAVLAGKCLEKMGRLVEASEKYNDAVRVTLEPGAPEAQAKAQAEAEERRKALATRIPSVEIALDAQAPDASVLLDGKPLPAALLGVKRPIDPGSHVAEVKRGGEASSRRFALREGETTKIVLKVPAAGSAPAVAAVPVGMGGAGLPPPPPPQYGYGYGLPPPSALGPPVEKERRSTGLFVTGIILIPVGGIAFLGGLVAVGVGSVSGSCGGYYSYYGSSTGCEDEDTMATGAALAVGGAVGLAAGITFTVVGGKKVPKKSAEAVDVKPAPRLAIQPYASPTGGGIRGVF